MCSRPRVTRAAGAGVDEKGTNRKTLPRFPPSHHTPRTTRERERRLETSRVLEPFSLNEG